VLFKARIGWASVVVMIVQFFHLAGKPTQISETELRLEDYYK
jgi:hypothetical protein